MLKHFTFIFLIASLLTAFLVSSAVAQRGIVPVAIKNQKGKQVGLYKGSYALVIGVSDYTNGWPDLPGVDEDLNAVGEALEQIGFLVYKIINPNRKQLEEAFNGFISKHGYGKDSRLLIYFAGRDDQEANPFNAAISSQVRQTTPQPVVPRPSVQQQVVSGGTGFLFSTKDYIITNWHVVKGAGSILAKFTNGETVEAKVVAKDIRSDIAILKLAKAPPLSAIQIKLGDSSQARMGEKVFTIGYPASNLMGERPKYSEGVINALTGLKDDPAFFQVSLPIQPGNSGGPLFNERGEVIGITTASLSSLAIDAMGAIPQNVNYAIKSSFVKNLLSTVPDLMLSKLMLANTGIVVIPGELKNSLPDFIEQVSKNIVLIETRE